MRLHDMLEFRARLQPDVDFAVFGEERISYAEADARANRIAHALLAAGLVVGDRVAVLAKNCIDYALLYFGASKAGVVPVPLNYRLAPPEWSYIVNDAGAKLLLARDDLAAAIDPVRSELGSVKRCVALGAAPTEREGWESWDSFLDRHPETSPRCPVDQGSELYQMYTSGTTGRPKGAVLTQRAVCWNLVQAAANFGVSPGDRMLIVAPLYHAAAAVAAFSTILEGGSLYIQEDFVPADVVRALSEEHISVALLVPAMIQFCLLAVPDVAERSYDELRTLVYGASAIAEQTLRQAVDTFRCDFIQAYGMTEATALATHLLASDHRRALREKPELLLSAGRPALGTELKIVDEDDQPVPTGEVGEILVRGPQLMKGYWNLEEETGKTLCDGWLHTGDAGTLDEEGYLYVQDRVKDMIVSGAENVYPREIEEVLYQHQAVAEAAAIGVPDDAWGEVVKAIVVLKPGARAGAEEILEFCTGRLGGFKRPRSVDFVEALPRNLSGKVLKRELREPYWQGRGRRVN
jgi:acyl-CoA synthetase (AMP-forming)/AMP-acid ligase II